MYLTTKIACLISFCYCILFYFLFEDTEFHLNSGIDPEYKNSTFHLGNKVPIKAQTVRA